MGTTPEKIWVCEGCGHQWNQQVDVADPPYCESCDHGCLESFAAEDYEDAEAFAQNVVEARGGAFV